MFPNGFFAPGFFATGFWAAPAPTASASLVAQWVRLALTGNPESTTPSSTKIQMLQAGAQRDLIQRYPDCLTGDVLTGDDFTEALGYAIAAKIVSLPGGGQFVSFVVSQQQGTVKRTYGQAGQQTIAEAQEALSSASNAALFRIECVRAALAESKHLPILALSGRSRSRTCGCF